MQLHRWFCAPRKKYSKFKHINDYRQQLKSTFATSIKIFYIILVDIVLNPMKKLLESVSLHGHLYFMFYNMYQICKLWQVEIGQAADWRGVQRGDEEATSKVGGEWAAEEFDWEQVAGRDEPESRHCSQTALCHGDSVERSTQHHQ